MAMLEGSHAIHLCSKTQIGAVRKKVIKNNRYSLLEKNQATKVQIGFDVTKNANACTSYF